VFVATWAIVDTVIVTFVFLILFLDACHMIIAPAAFQHDGLVFSTNNIFVANGALSIILTRTKA
jgi:hypothetical protein